MDTDYLNNHNHYYFLQNSQIKNAMKIVMKVEVINSVVEINSQFLMTEGDD